MKPENEKIMKYILITIFFFVTINVFAQKDTIFLKNGNISIGHYKKHFKRNGIWKTYNSNNILIEKTKYKYSFKHGKSIIYKNKQKIKEIYYYDIKSEDRTINGKRILAYYYYGLFPDFYKCDEYSCISIMIAGDSIWRGLRRDVFIHNLIINFRQKLRFGLKWKNELCNEK